MNTRNLFKTSAAILMSGVLAATTLGARGPENWTKGRGKPAEKPASVRMDEHPTGKCDGCKTTRIWRVSDRGPVGKGMSGARVTGSKHSCTGCVGTIATEKDKTKADMKHSDGCAKLACCS
jgi:hypothetical protein